jgi:hypothetical protein
MGRRKSNDGYSMTKNAKIAIIVLAAIFLILISCYFLLTFFFSSFAPPKLVITSNYISTDRDFINGVTIEKLVADSIGPEGYPTKYTTYYTTSCLIKHPAGKPPNPPNRIEFNKPGKYSWTEDTVHIKYIHLGLTRKSLDSTERLWWLNEFGEHSVCPLKFEREQWYFITIKDPKVTGLFFYIDKKGIEHQYFLASGVSPI